MDAMTVDMPGRAYSEIRVRPHEPDLPVHERATQHRAREMHCRRLHRS